MSFTASDALLRSLTGKGWDKPLNSGSLPYNAIASERQACLSKHVASGAQTRPEASITQRAVPKRLLNPAPSTKAAKAFSAAADKRLSSTARLLYFMIKKLARSGALETTKASLGGLLGKSRRTVRYALQELESFGHVVTQTTVGCLGLYSGLKILFPSAFDPAEFYELAAKAKDSRGAKLCTTSQDPYLLKTQRKGLHLIRSKQAAEMRLQGWLFAAQAAQNE